MIRGSVSLEMLEGGLTYHGLRSYGRETLNGYEDAKPQYDAQTNRWSSVESNRSNAWNCNFNDGNLNNNNKYNRFRVRPVVAYDTPADFLNLVFAAFHDCCRTKRTSAECIAYCERAQQDLPLLAHELYTGTYQPGHSTCFLVKYPKYREVFAAGFRDRIVHHFIYLLLNPCFEERFVAQGNVSFNCRKGFGTLAAQQAAFEAIRTATDNYRTPAVVYRGDLVSFFMSIDKRILWGRLEPFIHEEYHGPYLIQLLTVTRTVVFHCPEKNCLFSTDPAEWALHVPVHKSLFTNGDSFGMPIGNLTTQIFANFLMSFFDEFVIRWMKGNGLNVHYVRFVDDFLFICRNKHLLKCLIADSAVFLQSELGLTLHFDKHHFQPAAHGVLFVGAYLKNWRMYLSGRTVARFIERMHGFDGMLLHKQCITLADTQRMEQVVNSYLGFLHGKRTYNIRRAALAAMCPRFYDHAYIRGRYTSIRSRRRLKTASL